MRIQFFRQRETLIDRRKCPNSDKMPGMIKRLGTNSNPRRDRIGDKAENVSYFLFLVRVGDSLKRSGRESNQEIVIASHNLLCDRIGCRHITLGIESAEFQRSAINVPCLS